MAGIPGHRGLAAPESWPPREVQPRISRTANSARGWVEAGYCVAMVATSQSGVACGVEASWEW